MTRIVLFGTGNLGKRYIQAISVINNINLHLFDKSEVALKSVESFLETTDTKLENYTLESNFDSTISRINKETIVIISTTLDDRLILLQKVINKTPKAIICEKPVCQNQDDFIQVLELLKDKSIKTFVNFTLRMQPFYQKIKNEIGTPDNGVFFTNLPKTGLACVGIHQIDLFFWLFNLTNCQLANTSFANTYEQKRLGYFDVIGSIELSKNGFKGFINNSESENLRTAQIIVNETSYTIFEDQRIMTKVNVKDKNKIHTEVIEYSFVSKYMTDIIQNIISQNYKSILLPGIENSYLQHKVLFDYIEKHSISDLNFT